MKVVITGDIVNSRNVRSEKWLAALKAALADFGCETHDWEIYRGDSFQLVVAADRALDAVFYIKSALKDTAPLDVRMALGLGHISYRSKRVLESNGPAFVYSGECFEQLKKHTLRIKSDFPELDETLNLMFSLTDFITGNWKPVTAEIIRHKLKYPELTQRKLAQLMGRKSQASISEGLKRGGYDEIRHLIDFYKIQITKL
ncbi:SatD family protein [Leadbetterella sp. DM7]|uniref:SatD family protein n=1 Tax=Leadbetterella sp. DM7 TaxID=3235085 RepID=UPI00349ED967